jgi:hypothetical protein
MPDALSRIFLKLALSAFISFTSSRLPSNVIVMDLHAVEMHTHQYASSSSTQALFALHGLE